MISIIESMTALGILSPAAKTHFGGEPIFVRYSFF